MTIEKNELIIIGGGLNGLAMAYAAGKEGFQVALVDRQDIRGLQHAKTDGRASAIAYGSKQLFANYGIWDELQEYAEPILDIRVTDNHAPFFVHFDHQLVGDEPMGYMIENRIMLQTLAAAIEKMDAVTIHSPANYQSIERDTHRVTVTLDNQTILEAPLLVAADGKRSAIRKYAGIEESLHHDYQQVGLVCNIKHEHSHQGIAIEHFLPDGPFAALPLLGGHHSSLVWTEPKAKADHYLSLSKEELASEILQRTGDHLGAVEVVSELFNYPLSLVLAKDYVSHRLLLLGDAAHGIHPVAGQGLNLGIRDIEVILPILKATKSTGLDIGAVAVLEQYENARKYDVLSMVGMTHGLNRLFSNELLPVKLARRFGLSLVNQVNPLKQFFMKQSMGA